MIYRQIWYGIKRFSVNLPFMKRFVILILSAIAVYSCSPLTLNITVEARGKAELLMDLGGEAPAIVNIAPRGDKDSTLISLVSFGIAEKIEEDLELKQGDVPVYSFFSEELDMNDLSSVPYLFSITDAQKVVVLDSLKVDDFVVNRPEKKAYLEDGTYRQTEVFLPFKVDFKVFTIDSLSPEYRLSVNDSVKWTILSDEKVDDLKVIAKANSSMRKVFMDMGKDLGAMFTPQWEEQKRMIVVYENEAWMKAFQYADSFMWNEAMDLWLIQVKSPNPKKASFAAYNISIACEMLEQYDLALQWLDLAKSRYPFTEIEVQRRNVNEAAAKR